MIEAKETLTGGITSKQTLSGSTNVSTIEIQPELEDITITPTKQQQTYTHENSDGYDNVIINPIPDEYIIPKLEELGIILFEKGQTTVTPSEGYDGIKKLDIIVEGIHGDDDVEPDYIQDGLISWWEGKDIPDENGYWRSRVGDDYISQYTTALGDSNIHKFGILQSVKDKCYRNNSMYGLKTNKDYWNKGYTIEVVGKATCTTSNTDMNSTTGGATLFAFNKSSSPYICVTGANGQFCALNSTPLTTTPATYTGLYNKRCTFAINLHTIPNRTSAGTTRIGYSLNGANWLLTNSKNVTSVSTNYGNCTIMAYYQNTYFSCCEINSIRIYNRQLTEDELKHNYEIDKQRFNLDE